MIQTSYYANIKNIPTAKKLISISIYPPKGVLCGSAPELAPSRELLSSYRDKMITEEQYVEIYKKEVLSLLSPSEIASKYKDCVLLCYEKSGDFCHRTIVASWLIESGVPCPEIENRSIGIAIVGSRNFSDYAFFCKVINKLVSNFKHFHFVSGGAVGADSFAEQYAKEYNIKIDVYLPNWKLGKSAGFIRNEIIWEKSDIGIAFWDGSSKGTAHSFEIAKRQNKTLYVVDYNASKIYVQNIANSESKLKTLF